MARLRKSPGMAIYWDIDSLDNTLDFTLSAKRGDKVAKRFLHKVLNALHKVKPRVITVDENAAYPPAI